MSEEETFGESGEIVLTASLRHSTLLLMLIPHWLTEHRIKPCLHMSIYQT